MVYVKKCIFVFSEKVETCNEIYIYIYIYNIVLFIYNHKIICLYIYLYAIFIYLPPVLFCVAHTNKCFFNIPQNNRRNYLNNLAAEIKYKNVHILFSIFKELKLPCFT